MTCLRFQLRHAVLARKASRANRTLASSASPASALRAALRRDL